MSDYQRQVSLAAKGLAERDNYPMLKSVTTPEAFYEVMAAAALDAIDLPLLLERLTRAERELEIIREALRRADTDAENARHKPLNNGEPSEESSIGSILKGASAGCRPRTHNPRPIPSPRGLERSDDAVERRWISVVPPPSKRREQTRPPPRSSTRHRPNRTRRGSRRGLANYVQSLSWRKLLPLRSQLRNVGT
jgi:hypothetical protein